MMVFDHIPLNILLRGRAYLDPGSGSILIQVLVAGLLGAAFLVKTYWRKLTSIFTRKARPEETTPEVPREHGR